MPRHFLGRKDRGWIDVKFVRQSVSSGNRNPCALPKCQCGQDRGRHYRGAHLHVIKREVPAFICSRSCRPPPQELWETKAGFPFLRTLN